MDIQEPEEHLDLRMTLGFIRNDLRAMSDVDLLDTKALEACKIKVKGLQLSGKESLPQFFAPCPVDIPGPTDDYVDNHYDPDGDARVSDRAWSLYLYFQSYLQRMVVDLPPGHDHWCTIAIGDYRFKELRQLDRSIFGPYWIIRVQEYTRPHIKCIMFNNVEAADGELLRGEVLTILNLMLRQLKLYALVDNMIVPVLIFSLNGQRPRIIEAYFNGRDLVVKCTKPYDFTAMDSATLKIFAQWFVGEPKGVTSEFDSGE
ncbi:hypothetical protein BDV28DRAFT_144690 [Aspergillus coremiiformis]|uniref:Uncharacterized protein n=1 Tax=Aspergillus coremiiformis TaxID=138285 RepID=A0A5N6ZJ90_9EURO|nr:hypothetical protein BDV28DRAFT_144690 [Aspergillus coremiiformis]